MKGHIFNLLEKFIIELTDEETYEDIYNKCNFVSDGVFISPGTYPDEDLSNLVHATCDRLQITPEEAQFAFGKWIFPHLIKISPIEAKTCRHPKTLLLRLDYIHHIELKKIWPDAEPPSFKCEDIGEGKLLMRYNSPRQMFNLVDGVLESLAEYFKVDIQWDRSFSDHKDYQICDYTLLFSPTELE